MSNTIITIGRQYGSGGHKIGEFLSNRLQLPYYDDELMVIEAGMENALYYGESEDVPFDLYQNIIRKLAGKGDAIMIGRCADEILRGEGCKVLSVFIAAPLSQRVARTVRCEGFPEEVVIAEIERKDAARKAFYESHAGREWGVPGSYDLYYDTSTNDIGSVIVDIIRHYKALKDS